MMVIKALPVGNRTAAVERVGLLVSVCIPCFGLPQLQVLRRQTASLENPLDRVHASVKDPGPDLGRDAELHPQAADFAVDLGCPKSLPTEEIDRRTAIGRRIERRRKRRRRNLQMMPGARQKLCGSCLLCAQCC